MTPRPSVSNASKPAVESLRGAVLDAFRMKITSRLRTREATVQSADSPGAMINRLRNPSR
ncbi:MAG: hypothetical protein NVS2B3_04220 [Vulcanimicrobiaceae bacterium]